MNEKVDLSKGGIAVVMIGNTGFVKEYGNNPQVRFIDTHTVTGDMLATVVPDNTKAIILTEGLPQYHKTWAFSYAQRKNIPYLNRKSNQAIYDTLNDFFAGNGQSAKPTVEEVKETQEKGRLKQLEEFINFTKSNSENAKDLMKIAVERHIKTTEASLSQLVSRKRRESGQTAIVKSVRPKLDLSVELLDNMIKDLTDMREFLIATVEENRMLKQKVDKFKKALDD